MATDFKLLKLEAKNKRTHPNNIYEEKYPMAKDFIHAVMTNYNLSVRTLAQFALDGRYKITDKMFEKFIDAVEYSRTYSKEFKTYRRKILVRCNKIDLDEMKIREEDINKYELKLKKIL